MTMTDPTTPTPAGQAVDLTVSPQSTGLRRAQMLGGIVAAVVHRGRTAGYTDEQHAMNSDIAYRFAREAAREILTWEWSTCDRCEQPTPDDRMRLVLRDGDLTHVCWECRDAGGYSRLDVLEAQHAQASRDVDYAFASALAFRARGEHERAERFFRLATMHRQIAEALWRLICDERERQAREGRDA